jgi:hypothetical protein
VASQAGGVLAHPGFAFPIRTLFAILWAARNSPLRGFASLKI